MRTLNPRLCGLALAALLTGCSRSGAPKYEGNLDTVKCDVIAGWVWDSSDPNKPLPVNLFDGDALIGPVRAEGFRPDLKAAQKGDGNHGFFLPTPASLKDGRPHSIHAKIGESTSNWELVGSPQVLKCGP
jgi:hypothetical protein